MYSIIQVTIPIQKYPVPVQGITINRSNKALLTATWEIACVMSLAVQRAALPAGRLLPIPQPIPAAIQEARAVAAATVAEMLR